MTILLGSMKSLRTISPNVCGGDSRDRRILCPSSLFHYEVDASLSFLIFTRMPRVSGLGSPIIQSRTTSTSLDLTVSNSSISKRVMTRATVRKSSAYTRLVRLTGKVSRKDYNVWTHFIPRQILVPRPKPMKYLAFRSGLSSQRSGLNS